MSHQALSPGQFDPDTFEASQVGPQRAKEIQQTAIGYTPHKPEPPHEQGQLFPVQGHDYMLEPHQQTRAQFGNDPRTWWHGRYSEAMPKTGGQRNAGIHVGTFGSSDARRRDLGPSRKFKGAGDDKTAQEWRSFPTRIGDADVPHNYPDRPGYDEGATWGRKKGTYYYENQVENRGSVSALVPNRSMLMTHSDHIKAAKAAGKSVHPGIEFEAKSIGKDYDPSRRDPRAETEETAARWRHQDRILQPRLFDMNKVSGGAVDRRHDLLTGAGMMEHSPMTGKMHPATQEASMYLRYGHGG